MEDNKYDYVFSVENLNVLVEKGYSFRDAYTKISDDIKNRDFIPKRDFKHVLKGSIGNLCLDKIRAKMNKAII